MKLILLLFFISIQLFSQSNQADSLMNIGQYQLAIQEFQKETGSLKYFKIAKAHEYNGSSNEALQNYKSYLKTDSLNLQVNFNYGKLLIDLSKYDEAIIQFEKICAENKSEVYHYYLGLSYEKSGKKEKAFENYLFASETNPFYFKSNYKTALFYVNENKNEAAIEITNRFITDKNENIDMLKLRGQIYFIKKEYSNAIKDFEKILKLNQLETSLYEQLGASYYYNSNYDKALIIYTHLIENVNNENANYYYYRGLTYGFLNKTSLAESEIKKSIELKTLSFESEYFQLASFFQRDQNFDKALYYYQKTLVYNPIKSEAIYQIIAIKDYKGESPKKILADYENYLKKFKKISANRIQTIEARIKALKSIIHMK